MKQDALQDAEKYTKVHQRKKRWYQVVIVLACVVVFCTTYALILPAITLEKSQCEIPEHTHTESCYTQTSTVIVKDPVCSQDSLSIHKHTDACFNSEGDLTCGKADYIVHQHDDACYDADGKLWCTLPEVSLHTHNASCYEELPGHTHTEECYELVRGELTCGQDESDEHQHTDECYSKEKILTCTLSTDPQLKLICGKEEIILHQHTADCYDSNDNLICGKLEVLEHQHTDACFEITEEPVFTLTCGMEEHTHSEACTETSENGISMLSEDDSEDEAELLSDTEETTRSDLSKYIGKDTNFTSATYDPEKDQVEVGFHMTFAMDKKTIQDANYKFTYILPDGLTIPDDMVGKAYEGRDTSGAKGFTYQFVKNEDGTYSVQIDFSQIYVDGQENFSGYIDFSAYAGEEAWQEGGGYEFKFSDDVTVTIPVSEIKQEADESIHYNIDVSKSNSGYDAATNKITYTITVDTSKGTPDPLNLTDILTANGLEVDKVEIGSVTCVDYSNEWKSTVWDSDVTLSEDRYTFTYDSTNGIAMTLPALTKGSQGFGQKYTIIYDVYLKEPSAGASYTVDNKVTVTGTDSSKGEAVTDSAESTTTIDKSLDLQKYGTYDKSTGKIQWTLTVNQNGINIAGATLTDEMFKDLDWTNVTVDPATGYEQKDGILTFSGVNGDTNIQAYTITYETDAPVVGDDGTATVENTASVIPKGGGTSKDVTAEVKIDKNLKMVKTGTYDKATDTITWTITVNENGNDIAGAELTDTMFSTVNADSITVSPDQNGMSIVKDETTGTIQKITFSGLNSENSTNTQTYTITYTTPSGIDSNKRGTVTNTATLDSKPGAEGGEITSEPGVWVDRTVDLDKSNAWYDSTNNQLHWSISVNNNQNNIVGYTLTDDMFSQIVDGTLVIKLGYNSVDLTSYTNGFTIEKDDGKITSITFTAYDETGANTNSYTIEYCTEAKPGWDSVTVTNTANLTPPGSDPITDTGTGTIPADGSVYKKCQGATALVPGQDDSNITITWRTEINVPADGLPAGTVVMDTLANGQWMDWKQIQKWGSVLLGKDNQGINYWWPQGETYDITFYDTKGSSYTYADIVSNNGVQDKKFVKYEIKFLADVPAETYGGKTIYFEYESYADVSSVTDSAIYKNTVSVTPPNGSSKSSEASYTYKAPGVVKMDGDGNTGTTSIVTTNGELTWKVRVRLGADCTTLTLTDNLPEGVTLTGLTFANQALTVGTDGSITGTLDGLTINEDSAVTTDTDGKQTLKLTVTVPEGGTTPDYLKANGEFYVVYTCKISDELLEAAQNSEDHKVGTFTNKVTVTADSVDFPEASQTQEVTYTKPTSGLDLVNKGGIWNNDARLLEYSMLLNPDGMDLLPNSDTLTLTDVLSYNIGDASTKFDVALLPGSVNLYKAVQNEDGTWERCDLVTDWSWSVATRTEYDQSYSTITATIPDGTPLILEYAYNVWVPEGSSFGNGSSTYWGMYNKATLTGVSGGEDETRFNVEWRESETSAGITADRAYIFYKVEENSYGKRLPNAEFTLYDSTGNSLFTYTTDSNGSFTIQWQSDPVEEGEYGFDKNTLYYVQETKAPDGYELPTNPQKYYFYFSDATDAEHKLNTDMLPEGAVDLSLTTHTAYVENVKNTTQITVNKQWFGADGADKTSTKGGSISFDLYQIASTTPPSGSGGSESGGDEGGSGTVSTVNITFNIGKKYNADGSLYNQSHVCVSGSMIEFSITSSGYPYIYYKNGISLEPISKEGNVYTYQYTVTETDDTIYGSASWWEETATISEITITPPSTGDIGDSGSIGGEESTEPAGTYIGTYTISGTDGWTWSKSDLPLTGTDEDGNTVYYTYYVVEHDGTNYTTEYEGNDTTNGITSGTITIRNTESDTPVYSLPETGGPGTRIVYTLGSILMMFASAAFLYIKRMGKPANKKSRLN